MAKKIPDIIKDVSKTIINAMLNGKSDLFANEAGQNVKPELLDYLKEQLRKGVAKAGYTDTEIENAYNQINGKKINGEKYSGWFYNQINGHISQYQKEVKKIVDDFFKDKKPEVIDFYEKSKNYDLENFIKDLKDTKDVLGSKIDDLLINIDKDTLLLDQISGLEDLGVSDEKIDELGNIIVKKRSLIDDKANLNEKLRQRYLDWLVDHFLPEQIDTDSIRKDMENDIKESLNEIDDIVSRIKLTETNESSIWSKIYDVSLNIKYKDEVINGAKKQVDQIQEEVYEKIKTFAESEKEVFLDLKDDFDKNMESTQKDFKKKLEETNEKLLALQDEKLQKEVDVISSEVFKYKETKEGLNSKKKKTKSDVTNKLSENGYFKNIGNTSYLNSLVGRSLNKLNDIDYNKEIYENYIKDENKKEQAKLNTLNGEIHYYRKTKDIIEDDNKNTNNYIKGKEQELNSAIEEFKKQAENISNSKDDKIKNLVNDVLDRYKTKSSDLLKTAYDNSNDFFKALDELYTHKSDSSKHTFSSLESINELKNDLRNNKSVIFDLEEEIKSQNLSPSSNEYKEYQKIIKELKANYNEGFKEVFKLESELKLEQEKNSNEKVNLENYAEIKDSERTESLKEVDVFFKSKYNSAIYVIQKNIDIAKDINETKEELSNKNILEKDKKILMQDLNKLEGLITEELNKVSDAIDHTYDMDALEEYYKNEKNQKLINYDNNIQGANERSNFAIDLEKDSKLSHKLNKLFEIHVMNQAVDAWVKNTKEGQAFKKKYPKATYNRMLREFKKTNAGHIIKDISKGKPGVEINYNLLEKDKIGNIILKNSELLQDYKTEEFNSIHAMISFSANQNIHPDDKIFDKFESTPELKAIKEKIKAANKLNGFLGITDKVSDIKDAMKNKALEIGGKVKTTATKVKKTITKKLKNIKLFSKKGGKKNKIPLTEKLAVGISAAVITISMVIGIANANLDTKDLGTGRQQRIEQTENNSQENELGKVKRGGVKDYDEILEDKKKYQEQKKGATSTKENQVENNSQENELGEVEGGTIPTIEELREKTKEIEEKEDQNQEETKDTSEREIKTEEETSVKDQEIEEEQKEELTDKNKDNTEQEKEKLEKTKTEKERVLETIIDEINQTSLKELSSNEKKDLVKDFYKQIADASKNGGGDDISSDAWLKYVKHCEDNGVKPSITNFMEEYTNWLKDMSMEQSAEILTELELIKRKNGVDTANKIIKELKKKAKELSENPTDDIFYKILKENNLYKSQ